MTWWHALSMVGSLAVTGPIGLIIAVWLLMSKAWRMAGLWALLFGTGMALVVITKMAFMGWDLGVDAVEFAGVSGHAMRAAAVYPVAIYIALRGAKRSARLTGVGVGVILSILISISRVVVQDHTVSESVTGTIVGLAVAALFIHHASAERDWAVNPMLALLFLPVLLVAPRVEPVPAENWIASGALYLSGRETPYPRYKLRHLAPPPRQRIEAPPIH